MLTHKEEVSDRLERLLGVVQKLHTVSAIGFVEKRPSTVKEALEVLSRRRERWSFVDLRGLDQDAALGMLTPHLEAPTLVVAIDAAAPVAPLVRLVSAFIDARLVVEFGGGRSARRRDRQNLVVVCVGAKELREVPRELQRIAYWDFIP